MIIGRNFLVKANHQHGQLGDHLLDCRGSGENGLGDPVGADTIMDLSTRRTMSPCR